MEGKRKPAHSRDPETLGSSRLITICCICHRRKTADGHWEVFERNAGRWQGFRLSHAFCPECVEIHYPSVGILEK